MHLLIPAALPVLEGSLHEDRSPRRGGLPHEAIPW